MVRHRGRPSHALAAALAVALGIAVALPSKAEGQASAARDSAAEARKLTVARGIMRAARFAAFITRNRSGASSARTIDPLLPDSSFVVRFATNPRSRKIREIARENRVTLYYFDAASLGYVSVSGVARILVDSTAKVRHWKQEWEPFYPNRKQDLVIVEVIPTRLEVVSDKEGIVGDSVTWAAPSVRIFRPRRGPGR